jgi:hypothetical protein
MKKSLRTAVLTAALSAVALTASSSAMAAGPTGDYAQFKYCPYQNAAVLQCLRSVTTSGSFKLGTATVPITSSTPITFQGGFTFDNSNSQTTFYSAANGGTTLSNTPLNVPGGLLGLVNPGGFFGLLEQAFENAISSANGVTATAELAGTPKFDYLAFVTSSGPTLTLPIRVHLQNAFLGSDCYVGSTSSPITLKLTSGTTTPPAGTAPITGSTGTFAVNGDGRVATAVGNKLVDNAFSVPSASNCGFLLLDKLLITAAVNAKEGFPSAAGKNVAILQGNTSLTDTGSVQASVQ